MKRTVGCCLIVALFLLNGYGVHAASGKRSSIEMPEWNKVDQILPKYTKFTVQDIETGKNSRYKDGRAVIMPMYSR